MQPWNIIQELEADNSRLKKEAIIRRENDADNIRFFNGVCMALDGFRTFGVQKYLCLHKMAMALLKQNLMTQLDSQKIEH